MIYRNITADVREALRDTPVVLLNGARQVGKSTLAKFLGREGFGGADEVPYVTFDNATVQSAAQSDPDAYIRSFGGPVVVDEAQRVPDLFRAIKLLVDEDRHPGQFLLTGSADVMTLPAVSESLAGRVEVIPLQPYSQGELNGCKEEFLDRCFDDTRPAEWSLSRGPVNLWERIVQGGYPEATARTSARRRSKWFDSYITTVLQRDVRDLANIAGLTELPRLLQLLASRNATLVNYAEISRSSGLPASTLKRYLTLLEATFLIRQVPSWSTNLSKRVVRSPKLFVNDSGLAAHLIGLDSEGRGPGLGRGPILEAFVMSELQKQRTWSNLKIGIYHYRSSSGSEVDILLEDSKGRLVGLEVKAASRVIGSDFRGLRSLRAMVPDRFVRGIVLYSGEEVVSFEPDLLAVPIPIMWSCPSAL